MLVWKDKGRRSRISRGSMLLWKDKGGKSRSTISYMLVL